jgi:hypothetical protein
MSPAWSRRDPTPIDVKAISGPSATRFSRLTG